MSSRAGAPTPARVLERRVLSDHLVRLRLGLTGWTSSGVPDEWVALTVPGQFQTRYYTVRSATPDEIVLDVVVHAEGLVTGWASGDCVGDEVGISVPKGSFTLPGDARWLLLVADLTGLPALARIHEWVAANAPGLVSTSYVEAPEGTAEAYPDLPEPGPLDIVKGNMPATRAIVVIRIGRRRSRLARTIASSLSMPRDLSWLV